MRKISSVSHPMRQLALRAHRIADILSVLITNTRNQEFHRAIEVTPHDTELSAPLG